MRTGDKNVDFSVPERRGGFSMLLEETGDPRRCRLIDNKVSSRRK